jgi:hypothetical protein
MGQFTGKVYDLDFLSFAGYVQVALEGGVGAFQDSSTRLLSLLQVGLKTGFDTTIWYPESDCTSPPPALLAVKVEAGPASSVPLRPGYVTMLSFDARTGQGSTTVFNENKEPETYVVLNPLAQGILEAAMVLNLPTGYLEANGDKQITRVKVNTAGGVE